MIKQKEDAGTVKIFIIGSKKNVVAGQLATRKLAVSCISLVLLEN